MANKGGKTTKGLAVKLALAEAFVELAEIKPLDEITVSMIASSLGKHRKTFYYHFSDKQHLVIWLFRYELAQMLEGAFPPEALIYESKDGMFPELPYYVRNIGEKRRIYNAPFFAGLYGCFEKRRRYYRNVFSKLGPGTLEHYLITLYQPALADDVVYLIRRKLDEQDGIVRETIRDRVDRGYSIEFLAEFFTGAFISRQIQRLNYSSTGRTAEDIYPFENVIHDSLGWLIHQEVTESRGDH